MPRVANAQPDAGEILANVRDGGTDAIMPRRAAAGVAISAG